MNKAILALAVTYSLLTFVAPECLNSKNYGHDSIACVCTESQPCEKFEAPPKTNSGVITRWESSQSGARFNQQTLHFESNITEAKIAKNETQLQITIDRNKKYQEILGFGGCFTDTMGINVKKMSAKLQDQILSDYFSKDGLEYNIGRIPIGGTDLSTRPYSLDDVEDDKTLEHFALANEDHEYKVRKFIFVKLINICFHNLYYRFHLLKKLKNWQHMR